MINWLSQDSHVFVNDRAKKTSLPSDWKGYHALPAHIWIATSGTSSAAKWVALSKQAFLASSAAVNQHIQSNGEDIWLNSLPLFHVGGLSIYARAHLSGAKVESLPKWDAKRFLETKATLTSLVPAQVYDLVEMKAPSPPSLRAVFVGGGALSSALYKSAYELGWKLLPTFGMTECASQVATASIGCPELQILPHVQCTLSQEGLLQIRSESLLTGYLEISADKFIWRNPKQEGVFTTEDKCLIEGDVLRFSGRIHDWIKIGGENVSLFHLEERFERVKGKCDAVLLAVQDDRLGAIIVVAVARKDSSGIQAVIDKFNDTVMPYEKIRKIHVVDEIPRNALGKVVKKRLSFS